MKRWIRNAACVLLWVSLSLCALWAVNRVLVVKNTDGVTDMQNLYLQERGTVDVLLLGSSHSGMNLDTSTLWSEYGIASYNLWGASQPYWNTYHMLVEALKTQTPKVVVLETFASIFTEDYQEEGQQVVNTAGMRLSPNKWEAVKASAPKDRWLDLFFGIALYHERVGELTQEDYRHFPWSDGLISQKGSEIHYGTQRLVNLTDVSDILEAGRMSGKTEEYLRKIIALCQSKGIAIVLLKTPVRGDWQREQQPMYNRTAQIADEYGVPFYNLNLIWEELGFDSGDFGFDNHHLNNIGAKKATSYLGRELTALYDIPDRRGNPRYASWEEDAQRIQLPKPQCYRDLRSLLEEAQRRDWTLFVATAGAIDEATETILSTLNIPGFPAEGAGAWLLDRARDGKWVEASLSDKTFEAGADGLDVKARIKGWTWVMMNGFEVEDLRESAVILGIIDANTNNCIDVIRLGADTRWLPEHLI